ncbi:MAG: discoidin domain-containing protein, partial [Thomasclavelia spiroformis]
MKDVKIKVVNALLVGGMVLSTVSPQLLGVQARNDAAALLNTEQETTDIVNLAKGKTATASEEEPGTEFKATKAVDGIVNRDVANKADQSRWGTNQLDGTEEAWLKVDLGETKTFQSFVIAWERQNITGYQIQISNTGNNDWETVYTKDGNGEISDVVETIHLNEAVTAQYVRLLVTGYNGKYVNGNPNADWKSVSVYEFQVYENDIPDDLLPDENYNREGKATASNFESGTSFTADKAIDGNTKDKASRWATDTNSSNLARTLTIELPVSQRVRSFKIFWERATIEQYTISVSNDGTTYEDVYTSSKAVSETEEVITLD